MINSLVKICDSKYDRPTRCTKCENNCKGNCLKCFKDIHFENKTRYYNCKNIIFHYVCTYIYKYSSEIEYIFQNLKRLQELEEYKILSVGCGPCSDLMGIHHYLTSNNLDKEIKYYGADTNNLWGLIHYRLEKLFRDNPNYELSFINEDVFNILEGISFVPNIIILSYVISDMINHNQNLEDFFSKLKDHIIYKMPENSFILLNDVDRPWFRLNGPTGHFDRLEELLKKDNKFNFSFSKFNFGNYWSYGGINNKHRSNSLFVKVPPEIRTKYDSWEKCGSAQLIITKEN